MFNASKIAYKVLDFIGTKVIEFENIKRINL